MDIFMGGYGKLNIDSELLSVRFVYEEKGKILKKTFQVGEVRTSYQKQKESTHYH